MLKAARLLCGIAFALLSVGTPANSGQSTDGLRTAQLKRGLAAFSRHDYTAAGALLRLPAEHGDASAQAILCFLHTYGRGVPQSYSEAALWCRRAANQGNSQGQYLLGLMYDKGQGVTEDFVQAYKWLNLAATRASGPKKEFSYRIRDAVATKMSPDQVTKAQQLALDWKPALEQRTK
jgi:TPR repeat protein